ncbi:LuxR C-terminal-related transcriptional regulator [Alisedimentitalea sp. MJ-SS2]|uniref:helix-turn-helix transcriptional regulator n=1 Tax=Aliisedimentitalea sp. MJ-SS2 TaxID=3049795 RepID=UPI002913F1B5|nr:LuxR C-terminal-related transcriptional regulator [Alisedimentitalea sp. MJ-SS2]MDU8926118.1 LuxR C-terminal-related transcriptional regulator [Alisedimentitalea sp. MJ-SS2]
MKVGPLDHIHRILDSVSVEGLWNALLDVVGGYGFDRLFYVSTQLGTQDSWGSKVDWLLLTNHHREIVDRFVGEDLYKSTAKVHRPPGGKAGAYSWRETRRRDSDAELTEAEQRHLELTRAHDVTSGYTIWFPAHNSRSKSVLGMCARSGLSQEDVDAVWAHAGDEIHALVQIAHLKLLSLPPPDDRKRLTARQVEILEWTADGKTVRDIAEILDLSLGTVEKHLRQTRQALNVGTTAEAVLKAAALNQLFLIKAKGAPEDR